MVHGGCGVGGAVVESAVGSDVTAVLEKTGIVDLGVPITSLPTSDAVAEGVHYVAVIPASMSAWIMIDLWFANPTLDPVSQTVS